MLISSVTAYPSSKLLESFLKFSGRGSSKLRISRVLHPRCREVPQETTVELAVPWAAGIAAMHARRKRQSEARKQGRPAIAAAAAQNQGQVMSMRAR